ncbi:MAG: hypothetical protein Q4C60_07755 [Eubacteriales bacterium]|nr:hypothetical protein [Eubacteriales bacterium]
MYSWLLRLQEQGRLTTDMIDKAVTLGWISKAEASALKKLIK